MPFISFFNDDIKDNPEIKRQLGNIKALREKAQTTSRPKECILCGQKTSKFCNSHTIPQFILRHITKDQRFRYWQEFVDYPGEKYQLGIKEAVVFHVICTKCDGSVFSKYESPRSYKEPTISQEMMREIALKNYLHEYSNALEQYQLYLLLQKKITGDNEEFLNSLQQIGLTVVDGRQEILDEYLKTSKRNVRDYRKEINVISGSRPYQFVPIFDINLNYVVPVAVQTNINLVRGISGELINNIYDDDEHYDLYPLHICIFPLKSSTRVFIFLQKNHLNRYKRFRKDFSKLSLLDKLHLLAYLIPLYTESFLLAENINQDVINSPKMKELFQKIGFYQGLLPSNDSTYINTQVIEETKEEYSLSHYREIPNYLSEEYKYE